MVNGEKPVDRKQGVFTEWRVRRDLLQTHGLGLCEWPDVPCGKKSTASVVQEAFTVCLKLLLRTLLPTARSVTRKPGALNKSRINIRSTFTDTSRLLDNYVLHV